MVSLELLLSLELLEREKDFELANRIKRISPVSWKHVNFLTLPDCRLAVSEAHQ
jgi:hypothetical protein